MNKLNNVFIYKFFTLVKLGLLSHIFHLTINNAVQCFLHAFSFLIYVIYSRNFPLRSLFFESISFDSARDPSVRGPLLRWEGEKTFYFVLLLCHIPEMLVFCYARCYLDQFYGMNFWVFWN